MVGLTFTNNLSHTYAEELNDNIKESYISEENQQNFADFNNYVNDFYINFNGKKYEQMTYYVNREISQGEFFQNNCIFTGTLSLSFNADIIGDDNIVNLVPKQCFKQECEKYYIGDKYGYLPRNGSNYRRKNCWCI